MWTVKIYVMQSALLLYTRFNQRHARTFAGTFYSSFHSRTRRIPLLSMNKKYPLRRKHQYNEKMYSIIYTELWSFHQSYCSSPFHLSFNVLLTSFATNKLITFLLFPTTFYNVLLNKNVQATIHLKMDVVSLLVNVIAV